MEAFSVMEFMPVLLVNFLAGTCHVLAGVFFFSASRNLEWEPGIAIGEYCLVIGSLAFVSTAFLQMHQLIRGGLHNSSEDLEPHAKVSFSRHHDVPRIHEGQPLLATPEVQKGFLRFGPSKASASPHEHPYKVHFKAEIEHREIKIETVRVKLQTHEEANNDFRIRQVKDSMDVVQKEHLVLMERQTQERIELEQRQRIAYESLLAKLPQEISETPKHLRKASAKAPKAMPGANEKAHHHATDGIEENTGESAKMHLITKVLNFIGGLLYVPGSILCLVKLCLTNNDAILYAGCLALIIGALAWWLGGIIEHTDYCLRHSEQIANMKKHAKKQKRPRGQGWRGFI
jgi:hypothetical protein